MDKIYTGDIPLDYKYAIFHDNGNITLYNVQQVEPGETVTYYTILNNCQNKFIYNDGTLENGIDVPYYTQMEVEVSHNWFDRPDSINILLFTTIIMVLSVWLLNLITSIFKKGGLLGGLL